MWAVVSFQKIIEKDIEFYAVYSLLSYTGKIGEGFGGLSGQWEEILQVATAVHGAMKIQGKISSKILILMKNKMHSIFMKKISPPKRRTNFY
jgi:hypothetical protein